MSSLDQRLCLGVGGRKCGVFMSPLFRDPHPTCSRCRGRKCTTVADPHVPMPARIGTRPGPVTARGHATPPDIPQTARGCGNVGTGLDNTTTVNTSPGLHTPGPTVTLGPALRCPNPRCTI